MASSGALADVRVPAVAGGAEDNLLAVVADKLGGFGAGTCPVHGSVGWGPDVLMADDAPLAVLRIRGKQRRGPGYTSDCFERSRREQRGAGSTWQPQRPVCPLSPRSHERRRRQQSTAFRSASARSSRRSPLEMYPTDSNNCKVEAWVVTIRFVRTVEVSTAHRRHNTRLSNPRDLLQVVLEDVALGL